MMPTLYDIYVSDILTFTMDDIVLTVVNDELVIGTVRRRYTEDPEGRLVELGLESETEVPACGA